MCFRTEAGNKKWDTSIHWIPFTIGQDDCTGINFPYTTELYMCDCSQDPGGCFMQLCQKSK